MLNPRPGSTKGFRCGSTEHYHSSFKAANSWSKIHHPDLATQGYMLLFLYAVKGTAKIRNTFENPVAFIQIKAPPCNSELVIYMTLGSQPNSFLTLGMSVIPLGMACSFLLINATTTCYTNYHCHPSASIN